MPDYTPLANSANDQQIFAEDFGGTSPNVKMLGVKIHVGGLHSDGGPVTSMNGLPISSNGDVTPAVSSGQTSVPQSPATAAPLSTTSVQATRMIAVKAVNGNTVSVYVGGSSVTPTSGWELGPGESLMLAADNAMHVFVISGAALQNQNVSWIVI